MRSQLVLLSRDSSYAKRKLASAPASRCIIRNMREALTSARRLLRNRLQDKSNTSFGICICQSLIFISFTACTVVCFGRLRAGLVCLKYALQWEYDERCVVLLIVLRVLLYRWVPRLELDRLAVKLRYVARR